MYNFLNEWLFDENIDVISNKKASIGMGYFSLIVPEGQKDKVLSFLQDNFCNVASSPTVQEGNTVIIYKKEKHK